MSNADFIENGLVLQSLFLQRRFRLERLQVDQFSTFPDYSSQEIFDDNAATDTEMLKRLTSLNYTPPIVDELHIDACSNAAVDGCICLTYKDATSPQRGEIL